MKQKLLTLFLAFAASVGTLFAQSGTCGTNLTWNLDTESGTLTISGTGAMKDYSSSTVPWYSFRSSIKTVIIEDGVTSIGALAFCNYSGLTSVTIGESVTSIGQQAFYECTGLTSITIPNSITNIRNYAFSGCSSLTSITIPNSVTSIGGGAFSGCSSLTSITIPNSVTSIGDNAFSYCSSLTSITVDSENPNYCDIDGVLFNKNKTTLIRYPESKSATSYTIPNSVTSIGGEAFRGCSSLKNVSIASSVKVLEGRAFYDCSNIETITCYGMRPPTVNTDALYRLSYSTIVYVPADYLETYQMHEQWGLYDVRALENSGTEPAIYTITWQDEDGNVIKTDEVKQDATPAFTGTTPTKEGYTFAGWLPNIKPATKDMYYTTFFERNKIETPVYTVNINGENCSLNINNQYPEGTVITLEAVADECFEFQQWSDGNKDNPRTVTVTANTNLTAEFNKVRYTITDMTEPGAGGKIQVVE